MKRDDHNTSYGAPRWAEPWAAYWCRVTSQGDPRKSEQAHLGYLRRVRRVGVAAMSATAVTWAFALIWVWPYIA